MKLTVEEVVEDLNKLLEFLEPVHSLANSHFVSLFTENLWSREIPSGIQRELKDLKSLNDFIQFYPEIIQNNCSDDFIQNHPNLWAFISTVISLSFTNEKKYSKVLKIFKDLEKFLESKGHIENCDFILEEFMSKKKLHEVKITGKVTATLSNMTKSSHIVDVGGGKGYLSSILALHHSFKVLGLDSSEVTTCGAVKRSEKVAKLWVSGDSSEKSGKKAKEEFIKKHYKQVITFVRPETDVGNLLRENFNEETDGVTLTGLHTCGDLASTCLKLFVNNNKLKAIVNVGCCYHLISEEFPEGGGGGNEGTGGHGFPMSSYLRRRRFSLGRNARMLAAHSLNRMSSKSEWESSQTSLFYRAVLETVIKKESIFRRDNVGKIAKKCKNFHEYISKALKKLDVDIQMTEEEADQLLESFGEKKPMMTAFFLLRVTLAPIIESIILLDRILYLLENGVENAFLVRLFDLEISPRGFGIIAWKDSDSR